MQYNDLDEKVKNLLELNDEKEIVKQASEDCELMKRVIIAYAKPDFYYLCSDEIKKDFYFVDFLVNYIKSMGKKINRNHEKIVDHAVTYYLNNEDKKKMKHRFSIACDTIHTIDNNFKIHQICNEICKLELRKNLKAIDNSKEKRKEKGIRTGLGFYYIRLKYKDFENIMEVFAKFFINMIFSRPDFNLEEELHKEFSSPEAVANFGFINYLLNYIKRCDISLYAYLCARTNILEEKYVEIKKISMNWTIYNESLKAEKYNNLFERIYEYIDEDEYYDSKLSVLDIITFIAKELNISKEMFKYDCTGFIICDEEVESISYEYIAKILKTSFPDKVMYEELKEIFIKELALDKEEKIPNQPTFKSARNDLNDRFIRSKCKIISYDFKNHKKE